MGRHKNLTTIADELITGSCLTTLEVTRITATRVETVKIAKDAWRTKVLSHTNTPIVEDAATRTIPLPSGPDMQDGKPFQGYIHTGDDVVRFYGSPVAYQRLVNM